MTRSNGFRDYRGGGRSSARGNRGARGGRRGRQEADRRSVDGSVVGYVKQVGSVVARVDEPERVTLAQVETFPDGSPNIVRCPDVERAREMIDLIDSVRKDQDSIGGVSELVALNVPAGLGEPVFDKLKADLAKALFQPARRRGRRIRQRLCQRAATRQRAQRRVLRA